MSEEILNLSTIVERATINVTSKRFPKGKLYELVNLADLGPYEHAVIAHHSAEVDKLKALKKMTPAQTRQAQKLLDDTVKLVCPTIEPSVLAALTEQQKEMIVVTWSVHISTQGAAEGNAPPRRRTGAGSSRLSKRSTAATRKPGSTRRRAS